MRTFPLAAVLALGAAAAAHATEGSKPLQCKPTVTSAERGDPRVRAAAQKGLDYMAHSSQAWSKQHAECYGCHVHSVTLEGLVIGRKNQYTVSSADLTTMSDAMRLRSNGIFATTFTTARAFGGVALARYDRFIDGAYSNDLIRVSKLLVESQLEDGSVKVDDTRFPVESGIMQATFQSMQSWRQAYARTADDAWLAPIRKAEGYIQTTASSWKDAPRELQDLSYALMGLSAAGGGASEALTARLMVFLLARQNHDGGWGFVAGKSDAFATGQSLYALRTLGLSDKDRAIARGIDWLMQRQLPDGSWGGAVSTQGGSAIGEAMWAVLGLVSVDVMTVAVHGLGDGEHVDGTVQITADAKDNQGGGVAEVELFVDDLPVEAKCGARLERAWDTRSLKDGKHIVDLVATNAKGLESRRRFEVYAGKVFLTQVGARFDERTQRSHISFRNIAPATQPGTVRLEVFSAAEGNAQKAGDKVFESERASAQGAMTFEWDGKGSDGKPRPKGSYVARLSFRDRAGGLIQREETAFFHDSEQVQKDHYGAIEGQLSMNGGKDIAANTDVELVDDKGRVLQRVRSTEQGRYLFKNVNGGNYRVRTRKSGFGDMEQAVHAAPKSPTPATANFSLH